MPGEKISATGAGSGNNPGTGYNRINRKFTLTTECNELLKRDMNEEGTFVSKSREKAAQYFHINTLLVVLDYASVSKPSYLSEPSVELYTLHVEDSLSSPICCAIHSTSPYPMGSRKSSRHERASALTCMFSRISHESSRFMKIVTGFPGSEFGTTIYSEL